ncbi:VOC family protein [Streptomonospora nanhaiensis]|uniref:Catechol-2,3-dioxygenase n=1 Tax=Streptomonospora nanhaiensis TaxID=1323731 RepID=A0A853BEW3_9ACTN|nr:VOC family protein [Streptomonospora nanhaiensis]MBV2366269.1 VOC family protein [Streptomonospora nanhaiensis]MBX9390349.1 VOC family protein [Streptomonospora nanhaiensis]NYI93809.1 catechol-2,3-dioxygenase [Streptomonospora nanhaiensis]
MIGRLEAVVLDAADTQALARFYSELLGLPVTRVDGGWIELGRPDDPMVCFQHVPDHVPPQWPDPARSQQAHLDVRVEDIEAAEAAVLALGAKRFGGGEEGQDFRVYADPAGHPFCLIFEVDES